MKMFALVLVLVLVLVLIGSAYADPGGGKFEQPGNAQSLVDVTVSVSAIDIDIWVSALERSPILIQILNP